VLPCIYGPQRVSKNTQKDMWEGIACTSDFFLDPVWEEDGFCSCCCCEPNDRGVLSHSFSFVFGFATFGKEICMLHEKKRGIKGR